MEFGKEHRKEAQFLGYIGVRYGSRNDTRMFHWVTSRPIESIAPRFIGSALIESSFPQAVELKSGVRLCKI